jgi:hypothetical protein
VGSRLCNCETDCPISGFCIESPCSVTGNSLKSQMTVDWCIFCALFNRALSTIDVIQHGMKNDVIIINDELTEVWKHARHI